MFFNDTTFECWEVGYHSDKPIAKGQSLSKCDILDVESCYHERSPSRDLESKISKNFEKHGEEWIWTFLEKYWTEVFGKQN